jgi:hypothetical protein
MSKKTISKLIFVGTLKATTAEKSRIRIRYPLNRIRIKKSQIRNIGLFFTVTAYRSTIKIICDIKTLN